MQFCKKKIVIIANSAASKDEMWMWISQTGVHI
jgi:hypothetical protein